MSRGVSAESTREGPPTIFPVPNERHAETGGVPVPRTSFVGREREVGLVQALLRRDDVRLVTLTGPGGVGKTRTAIRAASSAPHSARFVDLADVQQPALVLPTIAAALGVRPDGRPVLDYLRAVLRHGDHLLVLDNFEQVLPAASTLADLLDACPNVTLLATSRAVLGVPGEHVVDVRPFPLPPPESDADAVGFDACRLFVDRARTLDPEFALTSANAGTVVGICRRLDGLPLAIELAASWVPVLSPGALLSQLERRLALPGGGVPGAPPRHRSLRDTIAWSYGLLGAPAQTLFRRLAVFNGGCTLDAVQEVCGDGSLDVLQELRTLVANSLVRRTDNPAGDSRYAVLETVREFGCECLEMSEEALTIHRRHAAYFLALAERVEAKLNTVERETWLDLLESEQGNLHGVLGWALKQEEAEVAVGLAGALLPFWQYRFHSGAGRDWVRRALALGTAASAHATRKRCTARGRWRTCRANIPRRRPTSTTRWRGTGRSTTRACPGASSWHSDGWRGTTATRTRPAGGSAPRSCGSSGAGTQSASPGPFTIWGWLPSRLATTLARRRSCATHGRCGGRSVSGGNWPSASPATSRTWRGRRGTPARRRSCTRSAFR
jgi:predicted ATPase